MHLFVGIMNWASLSIGVLFFAFFVLLLYFAVDAFLKACEDLRAIRVLLTETKQELQRLRGEP